MHCRRLKRLTIIIFSVTLLYYGVAWTALNCFHEDESLPVGLHSLDLDGTSVDRLERSHAHTSLECLSSNYHTESMAVSSSTARLFGRTALYASNFNVFWSLLLATPELAGDFWLRSIFQPLVRSFSSIRFPRFLSLSVLRI
jgi:hypothetical protein